MPESPEVETICRNLRKSILKKLIKQVVVYNTSLRYPIKPEFIPALINRQIIQIERRGKYLQLFLDNSTILIIHLGMTGKLITIPSITDPTRHDHVLWEFTDGTCLVYNDARRFGYMDIIKVSDLMTNRFFSHLGIEPLSDQFTSAYLQTKLQNKSAPIKNCLMDSRIIVGVGNIYAAEALFKAGIHPSKAGNELSHNEIDALVFSIKSILEMAIEYGGSSFRDYRNIDNSKGNFQNHFKVYNQRICLTCQTAITRLIVAGRATYFCVKCQSF